MKGSERMAKSPKVTKEEDIGTGTLRVLYVEDNPMDVTLTLAQLKKAGFELRADVVQTREDFAEKLGAEAYGLILADYQLPGWTGMEALEIVQEQAKDIPFILVTGAVGDEVAVECIKKGATDFILKDRPARLPSAIRAALEQEALRAERQRAEKALRASEKRYRLLFERNLAGVFRTALEGRMLDCNESFVRILGYGSRTHLLAHDAWDFYFSRADWEANVSYLKEQGTLTSFEVRLRRKDGSPVWVLENANLLEGEDGATLIIQGTLIDISERKRAEAILTGEKRALAMIARGEPLSEVLDSLCLRLEQLSPGMLCSAHLLDENRAKLRCLAAPSLPQTYKRTIDVIPVGPGAGPSGTAAHRGEPVTVSDIGTDPLWSDCKELALRHGLRGCWSTPIFSTDSEVLGTFSGYYPEPRSPSPAELELIERANQLAGIAIERKHAEDSLRASEERYRLLFERNLAGVFRTTLDGRILDFNESLARILGYSSREELLARGASELYAGAADREAFLGRLQKNKTLTNYELCLKRKDGSPIWVLENANLIEGEGGLEVIEGTVIDITERKQLEERLRQSQKMEAVGRLAGGIAHDFNNLLTIITGYGQLLLDRLVPGDLMREQVEEIKQAGDRAASLTRQLLAFSRRQVLTPQVLDLNAVVLNMDKLLRRLIGEDIDLLAFPKSSVGKVRADPGQIEQVILNLALNARDAMPKGGKLTIETADVDIDEAYASSHVAVTPGPYVMLAVSDTGCGMDREAQAHIFEPFFTTKEKGKGTGLGLAMVYGIVKQSGGNIWVYSEPGQGTTFKIYLPRGEEAVEAVGLREPLARPVHGSETILLVEDEPSVRSLVRGLLQTRGYMVLEAGWSHEALEISERYRGPIHLLLTDVVMPQMSGQELAGRLEAFHPETKVLYMSGYTDNAVVRRGVLETDAAFIGKPFTSDALARKVREVLDSPPVKKT